MLALILLVWYKFLLKTGAPAYAGTPVLKSFNEAALNGKS
jgi:hypothetical protein